MKIIEVDEELYQYIASQTQSIGESASDILRRLLNLSEIKVSGSSSVNELVETSYNTIKTEKSAVENPAVLSTENHRMSIMEDEPNGPLKVTTKRQSEASIRQVESKILQLLQSQDFQQENKAVVRFLSILTVLYRSHPESFAQAIEQETSQGRTRTYFARDEATLLAAGTHTKPKQIPDTPYWVITNTNSARKMLMLERAMQCMHLPIALIDEVRSYFIAN